MIYIELFIGLNITNIAGQVMLCVSKHMYNTMVPSLHSLCWVWQMQGLMGTVLSRQRPLNPFLKHLCLDKAVSLGARLDKLGARLDKRYVLF